MTGLAHVGRTADDDIADVHVLILLMQKQRERIALLEQKELLEKRQTEYFANWSEIYKPTCWV